MKSPLTIEKEIEAANGFQMLTVCGVMVCMFVAALTEQWGHAAIAMSIVFAGAAINAALIVAPALRNPLRPVVALVAFCD